MKQFHIILLLVTCILCGCDDSSELQIDKDVNKQESHELVSSYENYQIYLENLTELYWNKRFEEIITNVSSVNHFNFPESPTYFHYIFDAVQPLKEGRIEDVRNIISNFDLMIAIDVGKASCSQNDIIVLEGGARILNGVVSNKMCHEAFLGYYGNPNELLLREIEKYKLISDDLKSSIQ